MKIVHIITGLGDGGADGVLFRLCKYDSKKEHIVISLMNEGKYGLLLKENGINVFCLEMNFGKVRIKDFLKLYKLLKKLNPDIIQTWMYHANFFGGITAKLAGYDKIFWNIRHTKLSLSSSKISTIIISRLCALFSGIIPRSIICCAENALRIHSNLGYKKSKMTVIANGYDTSLFKPNNELRISVRNKFEFNSNTLVLGMVGRFHPQKNHLGLLKSFSIVKNSFRDFKCLLIGHNINHENHI